jgi:hypothetical protein
MWSNSIMERWVGSCRRELMDRTLVWNQRHLMTVLREYEDFCNTHRLHPQDVGPESSRQSLANVTRSPPRELPTAQFSSLARRAGSRNSARTPGEARLTPRSLYTPVP